ncbi:SIR2 family protein [Pseudomonas gingeri]|uniref:SIR2 family protein n=1 Tax=Pseudomonas gingeri TaxID=117681 RepID=A0A7Y7WFN0_9PSED|nr:SIR2 family protein [Pseudomonas gingeri]NWB48438.1 SIR2 family protein [Pseudomonas gingeri]
MPLSYKQYQEEVTSDILNVLGQAACQPILFVGSGFSKRYSKGPSWEELLKILASRCPNISLDLAYYKQKNKSLVEIGSIFSDCFREWAWTEGRNQFPAEYFSEEYPSDIFIKHAIVTILNGMGPSETGSYGADDLDAEIAALQSMSPHALITTNYDQLLELIFPDFERVVGQQVLSKPYLSVGEIFKIHGCISDPLSLVLTDEDYQVFEADKKYLSAKLLTYFAEHPLLFVGYRAEDPNIKSILYDVTRMFKASQALTPNIYILEWDKDVSESSYPARERIINVGEDVTIRVKSITASSFEWVFKAFGNNGALEQINVKLLRALMARAFNLVRRDTLVKQVEVNFSMLEHAVESDENFAKILGITSLDGPASVNANYPYTLQLVAEKLGFNSWNGAHKLIEALEQMTGFDMKNSDNPYHFKLKTGKSESSFTRKYSEAAVILLGKVQSGESFKLAPSCSV